MMRSLKELVDDFLIKLAKESQAQFGNEKLDCCKLDRPKINKK